MQTATISSRKKIQRTAYLPSDSINLELKVYLPGLRDGQAKHHGKSRWRVITKENVTTLFGWSAASRISDPKDADKIFEWLPEFVFDDKGNCSQYIYKKEDSAGF